MLYTRACTGIGCQLCVCIVCCADTTFVNYVMFIMLGFRYAVTPSHVLLLKPWGGLRRLRCACGNFDKCTVDVQSVECVFVMA